MSTADGLAKLPKRLISGTIVQDRLGGVSRTTLWRMWKRGDLPPPVRVTKGLAMWPEEEIENLISAVRAARVA